MVGEGVDEGVAGGVAALATGAHEGGHGGVEDEEVQLRVPCEQVQVPRTARLGSHHRAQPLSALPRDAAVVQHTGRVDHSAQRWHGACHLGQHLLHGLEVCDIGLAYGNLDPGPFPLVDRAGGGLRGSPAPHQYEMPGTASHQPVGRVQTERAEPAGDQVGAVLAAPIPRLRWGVPGVPFPLSRRHAVGRRGRRSGRRRRPRALRRRALRPRSVPPVRPGRGRRVRSVRRGSRRRRWPPGPTAGRARPGRDVRRATAFRGSPQGPVRHARRCSAPGARSAGQRRPFPGPAQGTPRSARRRARRGPGGRPRSTGCRRPCVPVPAS